MTEAHPNMLLIFADAYRGAALSGADMREATKSLETTRQKMLSAPAWYDAWRALDDDIGAAHGRPKEQAALLVVRFGFVREVVADASRRVAEAGGRGEEEGWRELARFAGEAVAFERYELVEPVASRWTTAGGHEASRAIVTRMGAMLTQDRWIESRAGVQVLVDAECAARVVRGRLWRLLGQIDLYQIRHPRRAFACFKRALAIVGGDAVSRVGVGEYRLREGRIAKAHRWGKWALRINADSTDAFSLMAECARAEEDTDGAERWYLEAIRRAPGAQTGYLGLCEQPSARAKLDREEGSLADLSHRASVVKPGGRVGILLACGRSCEQAGEYDRARGWYAMATKEFPDRIDAHTAEGYLSCAEGKYDAARASFERAVALGPDSHAGPLGMADLFEYQRNWAEAERWHRRGAAAQPEAEVTLLARAELARAHAGEPDAARESLKALLAQHVDDETVLGALETIAEMATDEAAVLTELEHVRDLAGEEYGARFAHRLGVLHTQEDRLPEAIEAHRRAVKLAPHERRYRNSLALALNAMANHLYSEGEYGAAVPFYREATEMKPGDAVLFGNLAGAIERDTSHGSTLASLEAALPAMRAAARLEPSSEPYRSKVARAERLVAAGKVYGKSAVDMTPMVTPLAVEIASDLVPLVDGGGEEVVPGVTEALAAMRSAVKERYGVSLPGVRFRGNTGDLPPSTYIIMLNEVPLVMGSVSRGKVFVTGTLDALNAGDADATPATHPRTGAAGAWVTAVSRERAGDGSGDGEGTVGGDTAGDALSEIEFIVAHVMGICERNLVDFVGVSEVRQMVVDHVPEDVRGFVLDTPGALRRLTGVVRALLWELVPVRAMGAICARFRDMAPEKPTIVSMVETMRVIPGVREHVLASPEKAKLCSLADDFAALIEGCIVHMGPEPELAMAPEPCQGALAAVRTVVGEHEATAIVVERPLVRHFTRKLVELEWPNLRVVSRSELDADPGDRVVASIGLED